MAHSLSAKKRVRQNVKHRARNRWRLGDVRTAVKTFNATVHAGKLDEAAKQLVAFYKLVDQIAATSTLHKNAAARYKSRLTQRLNAAKAPKAPAAAIA
jgi:small subunit ribosomal protein S20